MKMGPGVIIGIIIILFGLSLLFKGVPFFRLAFGGLLIFWGVSIIIGGFGHKWRWYDRDPNNAIFGETKYSYNESIKEYNVVFGKGEFNFRDMDLNNKSKEVTIHTVFGSTDIYLNKLVPTRITANSAFGEARMPNGNSTAFGAITYQNDDYGKLGLAGARKQIAKEGLSLVAEIPMNVEDTDMAPFVMELKKANADGVLMFIGVPQVARLIGTGKAMKFDPRWMTTTTCADAPLMMAITKGLFAGTIVANFGLFEPGKVGIGNTEDVNNPSLPLRIHSPVTV